MSHLSREGVGRYGHCSGQVAAVQIGDRLRVKAFGPGSPTEASNLQARSCRSHCSNRAASFPPVEGKQPMQVPIQKYAQWSSLLSETFNERIIPSGGAVRTLRHVSGAACAGR